ncbi:hypothetical protein MTR67_042897 [Solanum verrucosum]|uniref:Uncharacterized protein n=1 Tax=Solanum verrucosum TaxID=315347 RepID=A0AAF0UNP0_SOLVR|nr:hypothetical protein MTR67_042897 [Solanum verrucosum]
MRRTTLLMTWNRRLSFFFQSYGFATCMRCIERSSLIIRVFSTSLVKGI